MAEADRGLLESQMFFLKGWYTDLFTDRLTHSEFQDREEVH